MSALTNAGFVGARYIVPGEHAWRYVRHSPSMPGLGLHL
jgi:hypothetical protein